MYNIKLLREYYGLSQSNLATYLSISVSLLKMIESGEREIPSIAALKLAWMEQVRITADPPEMCRQEAEKSTCKQLRKLRFAIANMAVQIQKSEKEMATMQLRYQQALRRAGLLQCLRNQAMLDTETESKKDLLWLAIQWNATKKALCQFDTAAQALLQWKIISLLYSKEKAAIFEQLLQQNQTNGEQANLL